MQSKNTEQKAPKLTGRKAKAKVKMTEARWRVVFEEVGIGMALVDLDGNIMTGISMIAITHLGIEK